MCRSCFSISGSHQHGPPLLGRVRTPPRSPTSALLCSPPTPSPPSAVAPVVPRARGLPRCTRLVLLRRTGACANRYDAGDISIPAPLPAGSVPRRDKGLPGAWAILFRACRGPRPRRVRCAPRPAHGALAVAFRSSETLGTRNAFDFGALLPAAHSLACLRFARSVTVPGARLATGRAGSPLAGRGSHPLDDEQGFMVSSHTPILLDQPCLVAPKAGIHRWRPITRQPASRPCAAPRPAGG